MKKRPNRTARIERLIKLAELIKLANVELTDNQFEHFLDSMKASEDPTPALKQAHQLLNTMIEDNKKIEGQK